jgi:EmrB/QacA subfamily drug resistance transporter
VTDDRRRLLLTFLVAGAFFMENLDGTVIATALPAMAQDFVTTPEALSIGMTAYLLVLAVFIPASGWVAERFGARRVFAAALALFTLASLLCALSATRWEFLAARILQGAAGALMTPVGRLVVLRRTEKKDLVKAIAVLTWPGLTAPVLGPPIGGFITTYAAWPWIFLLNLPLGLLGILGTLWLMEDSRPEAVRPFDAVGFLLNGAGLGLLLFALDMLGQGGWNGWLVAATLAGAVVLGLLALRHAGRARSPLVSLRPFLVDTFRIVHAGGFLSRVAISTMPFLLPLLLQVGLGMSAATAGLLVLWFGLTNMGIKPWTTGILRRHGFRTVLLANTLISAASIAACALIVPGAPVWLIVPVLMLAGASRSMQFTALNTLAFADVPKDQTTPANTLFNMFFQLAIGCGIALGAILLRLVGLALPDDAAPIDAFRLTFLAVAVLSLLAVLDFRALRRDAGAEVSGHRPA